MMKTIKSSGWLVLVCVILSFVQIDCSETQQLVTKRNNDLPTSGNNQKLLSASNDAEEANNSKAKDLEARRIVDSNFVKDVIDRLHALDTDIGKLVYNSTTMYAPNEFQENQKGGEFTSILDDLDALQDEVGVLIANATKARQYNILIRLRPLNNILYRVRHNLHLMRNSLVAINTVSSLEKLGNSVLDSTLQVFMRPDANLSEELGDSGNYDINLDKETTTTNAVITTTPQPASIAPESPAPAVLATITTSPNLSTTLSPAPTVYVPVGAMSQSGQLRQVSNKTITSAPAITSSAPTSTSISSTTLTTTTTTTARPSPMVSAAISAVNPITSERVQPVLSSASTTVRPRTNQRSGTRRAGQRGGQRRNTTQKPSTTTIKPDPADRFQ